MREIEIEKLVLNCGGVEDKLVKSAKLLNVITGKKVRQVASTKRIPGFGVRPGLKIGCMVTIRGGEIGVLLKRLFSAKDNKIKRKQITENQFSFGIAEYLEIPDMEYHRDIGMLGLQITVVFKRKGKRIAFRKIKKSRVPKKQNISADEIADILKSKFEVEVE